MGGMQWQIREGNTSTCGLTRWLRPFPRRSQLQNMTASSKVLLQEVEQLREENQKLHTAAAGRNTDVTALNAELAYIVVQDLVGTAIMCAYGDQATARPNG